MLRTKFFVSSHVTYKTIFLLLVLRKTLIIMHACKNTTFFLHTFIKFLHARKVYFGNVQLGICRMIEKRKTIFKRVSSIFLNKVGYILSYLEK